MLGGDAGRFADETDALDEVVDANLQGFLIGSQRAAEAGRLIVMKVLVTAMRQAARSVEVADCAVRWRDAGVVGSAVPILRIAPGPG